VSWLDLFVAVLIGWLVVNVTTVLAVVLFAVVTARPKAARNGRYIDVTEEDLAGGEAGADKLATMPTVAGPHQAVPGRSGAFDVGFCRGWPKRLPTGRLTRYSGATPAQDP
jgi:hypothetical protein